MPYNTSIWQQDYWNIPTERRTAHAEQSNYSVMDVLALLLGNSKTDTSGDETGYCWSIVER